MTNKKNYILYIVLIILSIFSNKAYCAIEGNMKPYLLNGKPSTDMILKGTYNDKVKGVVTIIPLHIGQGINKWNVIPEYYISSQNDALGKITIGCHNADILMVDAGTFAVNNSNIYNDGNGIYSQSLINNIEIQGYKYKISYLIKRDNIYLSSAYSPLDNIKQVRALYLKNLSPSTDFKSSISIVNSKVSAGFNLRYLGLMIGGSYGDNFYTAGVGYSISSFKTSLSYLNSPEIRSSIFGMQYSISKNIVPFIQISKSIEDANYTLGIQFLI